MMWLLGISLITGFLFLAAINAAVVWRGLIKKEKTGSWVPLVGGLFGAVGTANIPVESLQEWWWVPLVVDPGSIPAAIYLFFWGLFSRR